MLLNCFVICILIFSYMRSTVLLLISQYIGSFIHTFVKLSIWLFFCPYIYSFICIFPHSPINFSISPSISPFQTGCNLNVHKMFRARPGYLLKVLCTFILRTVSMGLPHFSVEQLGMCLFNE